jgi:hypothetical protein
MPLINPDLLVSSIILLSAYAIIRNKKGDKRDPCLSSRAALKNLGDPVMSLYE